MNRNHTLFTRVVSFIVATSFLICDPTVRLAAAVQKTSTQELSPEKLAVSSRYQRLAKSRKLDERLADALRFAVPKVYEDRSAKKSAGEIAKHFNEYFRGLNESGIPNKIKISNQFKETKDYRGVPTQYLEVVYAPGIVDRLLFPVDVKEFKDRNEYDKYLVAMGIQTTEDREDFSQLKTWFVRGPEKTVAEAAVPTDPIFMTVDRGVATITLNRPNKLNTVTFGMIKEMRRMIDEIKANPDVKVVLFKGEGRAFNAGADIKEILANIETGYPQQADAFYQMEYNLYNDIAELHKTKPVVTLANGHTIGSGFGLAMTGLIVGTQNSQFTMPETKLGFFPDVGATKLLPERVGKGLAKWMGLTSATVKGYQAYKYGIADYYVSPELLARLENALKEEVENAVIAQREVKLDEVKEVLDRFHGAPVARPKMVGKKVYGQLFSGKSFETILKTLHEAAEGKGIAEKFPDAKEVAQSALKEMAERSPLGLHVSNYLMEANENKSLAEAYEQELTAAKAFSRLGDYPKGVNWVLDKNPAKKVPDFAGDWQTVDYDAVSKVVGKPVKRLSAAEEAAAEEALPDPYFLSSRKDWDALEKAYHKDPNKFWLNRFLKELGWMQDPAMIERLRARVADWERDAATRGETLDPNLTLIPKLPTIGVSEKVDDKGHFSFKYAEDGVTNASWEIIDRQVNNGYGDQIAYTWIGDTTADETGNPAEVKTMTYKELQAAVEKFANGLWEMGVRPGDGITLYTASNTIEAKIARFAAMRIGAVFTPVFPGLAAQELSDRAHQIKTKVVITVNAGSRKGEKSSWKAKEVDRAFEDFMPLEQAREALKTGIASLKVPQGTAESLYQAVDKRITGMITVDYHMLGQFLGEEAEKLKVQVPESAIELATEAMGDAYQKMPSRIKNMVVIERFDRKDLTGEMAVPMKEGRDVYFNDVIEKMEREGKVKFDPIPVNAEQPLFVIFTSGTTGKPKGAYHTTAGYLANIRYAMQFAWDIQADLWKHMDQASVEEIVAGALAMKEKNNLDGVNIPVFMEALRHFIANITANPVRKLSKEENTQLRDALVRLHDNLNAKLGLKGFTKPQIELMAKGLGEVARNIWVSADDGWITGNSAMSDAPLQLGMHSHLYEGLPNWPVPDRLWLLLEKFKINYYKTGVTAVRDASKGDASLITRHNLTRYLRNSCSCAEPLYAFVQAFWETVILGGNKDGFGNYFWRTEDGMFNFIPHPLGKRQKDDASSVGAPWIQTKVLKLVKDANDKVIGYEEAQPGEVGSVFIRHHPSMIRGLWGDEDRFRDTYWPEYAEVDGERWHKVGDAGKMDDDGYVTFLGRDDEVLNVNGNRLGTAELEAAISTVREVSGRISVVGIPHNISGETPVAFVVLNAGVVPTPDLDTKIRKAVETNKGKIARPSEIFYVSDLPQTMSKKYLRRFLEIIAALPREELARMYELIKDVPENAARRAAISKKDRDAMIAVFGETLYNTAQSLEAGPGGTNGLIAAVIGVAEKREIGKVSSGRKQLKGDRFAVDFMHYMPVEAKDVMTSKLEEAGYVTEGRVAKAKQHYEMVDFYTKEAARKKEANTGAYVASKLKEKGIEGEALQAALKDHKALSGVKQAGIDYLIEKGLLWPMEKPFVAGRPLPKYMFAWAAVKDSSGRPVYGDPADAYYPIIAPTPKAGPNEFVGYTLYSGVTRNQVASVEDMNVGSLQFTDDDYFISGSDATFVVAEVGAEVEAAGKAKVGEVAHNYSGQADLMDPRMGYDPLATPGFKIQGYQSPGWLAQFGKGQGDQIMRKPRDMTLEESSSHNLDLITVYKAIMDRAKVQPGEWVFVEGAAGGTGHLAVEVAAARGANVIGLVSSDERGQFALEHGAKHYIKRNDPRWKDAFQSVPDQNKEPEKFKRWREAADALKTEISRLTGGHMIDMINASVGAPTFAVNREILGKSGRLTFYGADKGFRLNLLGAPGEISAAEAFRTNDLRPGEGVLVYYGAAADGENVDLKAIEAIEEALAQKGRVVVMANTVAQQILIQHMFGKHPNFKGAECIENLKQNPLFEWPEELPDMMMRDEKGVLRVDPDKRYYYQLHTQKIIGAAVGRFFASPDNPTGFPDVIVERAGQNTLGISAWMVRPQSGRVLYLEDTANKKFTFYAPDVWFTQKTIRFGKDFSVLGTHLASSFQAEKVTRLIEQKILKVSPPTVYEFDKAPEAIQDLNDGTVVGTNTIRVGAPPVKNLKLAQELYSQWGVRYEKFGSVSVLYTQIKPGEEIATMTIESGQGNALSGPTVESIASAVDAISRDPKVKAVVLTGGGNKFFVAGADIKELQTIIDRTEGTEIAEKAQAAFGKLEALNIPVVTAINGFALGGGTELAMSTHYRVASAKAEMGQPEINLGLIPGFGGTQRLPRLLRARKGDAGIIEAAKIILNGRRISAEKAKEIGLVDEVAESDALSRAMDLAIEYIDSDGKSGKLAQAMENRHKQIVDWDKPAPLASGSIENNPEIREIIQQSTSMGRVRPVEKALAAIYTGFAHGITQGLESERKAFGELIVGPNDGRLMIEAFLAKLSPPLPARGEVEPVRTENTVADVSDLIEKVAKVQGIKPEQVVDTLKKSVAAPAGGPALTATGMALTKEQDTVIDMAIRTMFDPVFAEQIARSYGYPDASTLFPRVEDTERYVLNPSSDEYKQLDPEGLLASIGYKLYDWPKDLETRVQTIAHHAGVQDIPTVLEHPSVRFPSQGHLFPTGRDWILSQSLPIRMAFARHLYLHAMYGTETNEAEIQKMQGGEFAMLVAATTKRFGGEPVAKLPPFSLPDEPSLTWSGKPLSRTDGCMLDLAVGTVYDPDGAQAADLISPNLKSRQKNFFDYAIATDDPLLQELDPEGYLQSLGFTIFILPELVERVENIAIANGQPIPNIFAHFSAKDWARYPRREYIPSEYLANFLNLSPDLRKKHARYVYTKLLNPRWTDSQITKFLRFDMADVIEGLKKTPSREAVGKAMAWLAKFEMPTPAVVVAKVESGPAVGPETGPGVLSGRPPVVEPGEREYVSRGGRIPFKPVTIEDLEDLDPQLLANVDGGEKMTLQEVIQKLGQPEYKDRGLQALHWRTIEGQPIILIRVEGVKSVVESVVTPGEGPVAPTGPPRNSAEIVLPQISYFGEGLSEQQRKVVQDTIETYLNPDAAARHGFSFEPDDEGNQFYPVLSDMEFHRLDVGTKILLDAGVKLFIAPELFNVRLEEMAKKSGVEPFVLISAPMPGESTGLRSFITPFGHASLDNTDSNTITNWAKNFLGHLQNPALLEKAAVAKDFDPDGYIELGIRRILLGRSLGSSEPGPALTVTGIDLSPAQDRAADSAFKTYFDENHFLKTFKLNQGETSTIFGAYVPAENFKLAPNDPRWNILDPEGLLRSIDYKLFAYDGSFERRFAATLRKEDPNIPLANLISHPSTRFENEGHLTDYGFRLLSQLPAHLRAAWARHMFLHAKHPKAPEAKIQAMQGQELYELVKELSRRENEVVGIEPLGPQTYVTSPAGYVLVAKGEKISTDQRNYLDAAVETIYGGHRFGAEADLVAQGHANNRTFRDYQLNTASSENDRAIYQQLDPAGVWKSSYVSVFAFGDMLERAQNILTLQEVRDITVPDVYMMFSNRWTDKGEKAYKLDKAEKRVYIPDAIHLQRILRLPKEYRARIAAYALRRMQNPGMDETLFWQGLGFSLDPVYAELARMEKEEEAERLAMQQTTFNASAPDHTPSLGLSATSLVAADLVHLGHRGINSGVDKKAQKALYESNKADADERAEQVTRASFRKENVSGLTHAAEGAVVDEIANALQAAEIINPGATGGMVHILSDVIEGTDATATNNKGKTLAQIGTKESGGTSALVTGPGVEALGIIPESYAEQIYTHVPPAKRWEVQDFLERHALAAEDEATLENVLKVIADANGITINDIELVTLDRPREAKRFAALDKIKERYPGLDFVRIDAGTVAHGLLAAMGVKQGRKHKVMLTGGKTTEAAMNLAIAAEIEGGVGAFVAASKDYTKNPDGTPARDLSNRTNWNKKELAAIEKQRAATGDVAEYKAGTRVFGIREIKNKGSIEGNFSFITDNGVFNMPGVRKIGDNLYRVHVLRVRDGKASVVVKDVPYAQVAELMAAPVTPAPVAIPAPAAPAVPGVPVAPAPAGALLAKAETPAPGEGPVAPTGPPTKPGEEGPALTFTGEALEKAQDLLVDEAIRSYFDPKVAEGYGIKNIRPIEEYLLNPEGPEYKKLDPTGALKAKGVKLYRFFGNQLNENLEDRLAIIAKARNEEGIIPALIRNFMRDVKLTKELIPPHLISHPTSNVGKFGWQGFVTGEGYARLTATSREAREQWANHILAHLQDAQAVEDARKTGGEKRVLLSEAEIQKSELGKVDVLLAELKEQIQPLPQNVKDHLTGKVAVITGGGTGMGQSTALEFAKAGSDVVIMGRRMGPLMETKAMIEAIVRSMGGKSKVLVVQGDVSDPNDVPRMFQQIQANLGRVDFLINNAGVSGPVDPLTDVDQKEFDGTVDIHLTGTWQASMEAAKIMKKNGGGKIINVGTFFTEEVPQDQRPYPGRTPYTAAQGAKNRLTELMALELQKDGIEVVGTNPGPVKTERIEDLQEGVYFKGAKWRLRYWVPGTPKPSAEDIEKKTKAMIVGGEFLSLKDIRDKIIELAMPNRNNGQIVAFGSLRYRTPPAQAIPSNGVRRLPDMNGQVAVFAGYFDSDAEYEKLRETIQAYVRSGATIVLAGPSGYTENEQKKNYNERMEKMADVIAKSGAKVYVQNMDLGNVAAVKDLFTTVRERFGSINNVIYSTGNIDASAPISELDRGKWDGLVKRFIKVPAIVAREAINASVPGVVPGSEKNGTLLKDANTSIVLIGPDMPSGKVSNLEKARVEVFRGALRPFVATASMELKAFVRSPIRINLVTPGREDGRQADTKKLASAVLFLGSDEAKDHSGLIYYADEVIKEVKLPTKSVARRAAPGPLAGFKAVVTGGAKQMGGAISLELAMQGAGVVINGTDEIALAAKEKQLARLGAQTATAAGDVSKPESVEKLIDAANQKLGTFNVLVNNAGIAGGFAKVEGIPIEDLGPALAQKGFKSTLWIDFVAPWLLTVKTVFQWIREGHGGAIINISTDYVGEHPEYIFRPLYTVPKMMMKVLTRLLARALRPFEIYIVDIRPSLIKGDRMDLVVKGNVLWFEKEGILKPEIMDEMGKIADALAASDKSFNAHLNELKKRMGDGATQIPEKIVRQVAWITYTLRRDLADISADENIPGRIKPMLEYFKEYVPTQPPTNEDVAKEVAYCVKNARYISGQSRMVTTLPPVDTRNLIVVEKMQQHPPKTDGLLKNQNVMIATSAVTPGDLEKVREIIVAHAKAGAANVRVIVSQEASRAELQAALDKAATLGAKVHVEVADFTSEDALKGVFESQAKEQAIDSVVYIPGSPAKDTSFISGFLNSLRGDALKNLKTMNPAQMTDAEGGIATQMNQFLSSTVTASVIVAREAAKYLPKEGSFVVLAPSTGNPEDELIKDSLEQVVRLMQMERRMLTEGKRVRARIFDPEKNGANVVADMIVAMSVPKEVLGKAIVEGPLSGHTAIVTGGAKQMGGAISLEFAKRGAGLVINGTDEKALTAKEVQLTAIGAQVATASGDVSQPESVEKLIATANEKFGTFNVLINNAGIAGGFAKVEGIPIEDLGPALAQKGFKSTLWIDFVGPWLLTVKTVFQWIREGHGGTIVNISTDYVGEHPEYIFRPLYTVPKMMLKVLTRLLARALRPFEIYIVDIRPSLIKGDRMDLVVKGNVLWFEKEGIIKSEIMEEMGKVADTLAGTDGAFKTHLEDLKKRMGDKPTEIPERIVRQVAWITYTLRRELADISADGKIPERIKPMLEYFKEYVPTDPPTNEDVAKMVAFAVENGKFLSGQSLMVTTLPPVDSRDLTVVETIPQYPPRVTNLMKDQTVMITTAATTPADLEKVREVISAHVKAGVKNLNLVLSQETPQKDIQAALDQAVPARVKVTVSVADFTDENALKRIFEEKAKEGSIDSIVHIPGTPPRNASFMSNFLDVIRGEALKTMIPGHVADTEAGIATEMTNFLNRTVTGSVIVAREAAKYLPKDGSFVVLAPTKGNPEDELIKDSMEQVVRLMQMERRMLTEGKRVRARILDPELNDADVVADSVVAMSLPKEVLAKAAATEPLGTGMHATGKVLTIMQDRILDEAIRSYYDEDVAQRYGFANKVKDPETFYAATNEDWAGYDIDGKLRAYEWDDKGPVKRKGVALRIYDDLVERMEKVAEKKYSDTEHEHVPYGVVIHTSNRMGAVQHMDRRWLQFIHRLPDKLKRLLVKHELAHHEHPRWDEEHVRDQVEIMPIVKYWEPLFPGGLPEVLRIRRKLNAWINDEFHAFMANKKFKLGKPTLKEMQVWLRIQNEMFQKDMEELSNGHGEKQALYADHLASLTETLGKIPSNPQFQSQLEAYAKEIRDLSAIDLTKDPRPELALGRLNDVMGKIAYLMDSMIRDFGDIALKDLPAAALKIPAPAVVTPPVAPPITRPSAPIAPPAARKPWSPFLEETVSRLPTSAPTLIPGPQLMARSVLLLHLRQNWDRMQIPGQGQITIELDGVEMPLKDAQRVVERQPAGSYIIDQESPMRIKVFSPKVTKSKEALLAYFDKLGDVEIELEDRQVMKASEVRAMMDRMAMQEFTVEHRLADGAVKIKMAISLGQNSLKEGLEIADILQSFIDSHPSRYNHTDYLAEMDGKPIDPVQLLMLLRTRSNLAKTFSLSIVPETADKPFVFVVKSPEAKGPTAGNMGESKFPEEVKRSWLENTLRQPEEALFVKLRPGQEPVVSMGRLVEHTQFGDNIVRRALSADEMERYAPIIQKLKEAGELLKTIQTPAVKDGLVSPEEIRQTSIEMEFVILPRKLLVAGSHSAHAATTFGERDYMGELFIRSPKIDAAKLAEHIGNEGTHIAIRRKTKELYPDKPELVTGDPDHTLFQHTPDSERDAEAVIMDQYAIADKEAAAMKVFETKLWLECLKAAGAEGKKLYLNGEFVPQGKPFLRLDGTEQPGNYEIFARVEQPVESFPVRMQASQQDTSNRSPLVPKEPIFGERRPILEDRPARAKGTETHVAETHIDHLEYKSNDAIVIAIGDRFVVLKGEDFDKGIPSEVRKAYNFERQNSPVNVYVVAEKVLKKNVGLKNLIAGGIKPTAGNMAVAQAGLQIPAAEKQALQGLLTKAMAGDKPKYVMEADAVVVSNKSGEVGRITAPTMAKVLRKAGRSTMPLLQKPAVTDAELEKHLAWLEQAANVAAKDGFVNGGGFAAAKQAFDTALNQSVQNVKAITVAELEKGFADPATLAIIEKDMQMGVRYLVLTPQGEDPKASLIRLGKGNITDGRWLYNPETKEGGIHILPAITSDGTVNVDQVITEFTPQLSEAIGQPVTPQIWKTYLTDPTNPNEKTGFVVALGSGIRLTGRANDVRHFNVENGMRLSEILDMQQGLFSKSLPQILAEHHDALIAAGYTDAQLGAIAANPELLLAPIRTKSDAEELNTRKGEDTLTDWTA